MNLESLGLQGWRLCPTALLYEGSEKKTSPALRRRGISPGFPFLFRESEHLIPEGGVCADNPIHTISTPGGAESEGA